MLEDEPAWKEILAVGARLDGRAVAELGGPLGVGDRQAGVVAMFFGLTGG